MARGGYRPGAGRKKAPQKSDAATVKKIPRKKAVVTIAEEPTATDAAGPQPQQIKQLLAQCSPLAYMLNVMNDPCADDDRRDRMAVNAAPYIHSKRGEMGKKDTQSAAAKKAGSGRFAQGAPPLKLIEGKN